jgi:hypothetical protein
VRRGVQATARIGEDAQHAAIIADASPA